MDEICLGFALYLSRVGEMVGGVEKNKIDH